MTKRLLRFSQTGRRLMVVITVTLHILQSRLSIWPSNGIYQGALEFMIIFMLEDLKENHVRTKVLQPLQS